VLTLDEINKNLIEEAKKLMRENPDIKGALNATSRLGHIVDLVKISIDLKNKCLLPLVDVSAISVFLEKTNGEVALQEALDDLMRTMDVVKKRNAEKYN